MRRCWAACLGDCSDKISGEHIITDGLFSQPSVRVKGLPWCLDDFKAVGLASLVRNVLCAQHNSRLSEADVGAIQLSKAIVDSACLSEARKLTPVGNWQVKTFSVNGLAFERWCLKTLITIALDGPAPIWDGRGKLGEPSPELVETAFGLRQFQPPRAGMYWIGEAGENISVNEGVVVSTFSNQAKHLVGARFWFFGMTFLLILNDGPIGPFTFTSMDGKQTTQPKVWYRPRRIGMDVNNRPSHILNFVWQDHNSEESRSKPASPS